MAWYEILFKFIGGLGIFLFGIKYMSDGLQKTAGNKMRGLIEKYTTNPIAGVLVGIVVTILIQSSSGTTVLTVGLVNAGLMTLRQAIGIVMGANIGTTMTAFLIGIKIEDYALPIIAFGVILLFFFKKKILNYIGQVIFGFGMLFFGLSTMGGGVKPLKDLPVFADFISNLSEHPILGVIVGTVFTVIVQSSSATIGILQTIADEGIINLKAALPVLFGDNIGTTITAVLAAIGASVAAKRTAAAHVIFNVVGTIIFVIALDLVAYVVGWAGQVTGADLRMQIAYAHGFFNVTNVIIQLPFIGILAIIVTKLIPGEMKVIEFSTKYLDPRLLNNPSVAIGQVKHEIIRMGQVARDCLKDASDFFLMRKDEMRNMAVQREALINTLDKKITEYLVKLQQSSLNQEEASVASLMMQSINDFERIGDHAENIMELTDFSIENKVSFSDDAVDELKQMMALADETIYLAIEALEGNNEDKAKRVLEIEKQLDQLEREYKKNHIQRLNQQLCTGNSGAVFLDIISNLERVGDHSKNIAQYVLNGE